MLTISLLGSKSAPRGLVSYSTAACGVFGTYVFKHRELSFSPLS